mmetsp:Transcript_159096/g.510241  ORF Transcript_159096/g.510241 Transcript_159096/m.510241 type:complete len:357 (-) Transcript_159096:56-1126(-)
MFLRVLTLVLSWACCICSFDPTAVRPGEKAWGYVKVVDNLAAKIDMPVMVVNGISDGPTLAVTAGLYPLENCGIEAAGQIYAQVDPQQLSGKLVVVPVVNMPVLQFRTPMFALAKSLSPLDGKDINELFPGRANGTVSDVLAHKLFSDVILGADFHVDLRGGEVSESHLMHTIYLEGLGNMTTKAKEMAATFGLQYVIFEPEYARPGPLIYEAMSRGIPSIVSESGLGFNPQPGEREVRGHVDGVMNLLKSFGMLPGVVVPPDYQHFLLPDRIELLAPATGMFKHIPDQGDAVKKGEPLGLITDLDGTILADIRAPDDVVVHEMMPRRLVYQGDRIYHLARLGPPVRPPRVGAMVV